MNFISKSENDKQLAKEENLKKLPDLCYGELASTGDTIIIKRGVDGYYPSQIQSPADELNEKLGVTKAQRRAMELGSMFGWHIQGANPDMYDDEGMPKK